MHGWSWSLELLAYVCAAAFAGIQEQLQLQEAIILQQTLKAFLMLIIKQLLQRGHAP